MNLKTLLINRVLAVHFNQKKTVLNFLANFISALLIVRSVNWVEIAQAMEGKEKPESKYKKIQRYFRALVLPEKMWVDWVLSYFPQDKYRLSLDRTNWQIGKKKINYLVLAVVLEHSSIPIYWKLLPKKGNSNFRERIEMIDKFLAYPGIHRLAYLTADREFACCEVLQYMLSRNLRFCFRIRNNSLIGTQRASERGIQAKEYLKKMAWKQVRLLKTAYIWGFPVSIALRREKKDSVVLITNFEVHQAMKNYRKRWTIEQLFQNLKSRGFNLETTHVTNLERLSLLLGILTLAYTICYATGSRIHQEKKISRKKHGRLAKSIFRVGLDQWRDAIFQFFIDPQKLRRLVNMHVCWIPLISDEEMIIA
jgi:hypothetical protein